MNTPEKADLSVTTFNTVVVHKNELLKTLEVNREKHNSIYNAAVSGYWVEAQKVVDKKKVEFDEAVAKVTHEFGKQQERLQVDFAFQASGIQSNVNAQDKDRMAGFSLTQSFSYGLGFNAGWPLIYPENHLDDYDRVIDMLKFSVADKVELSSQDFDAYVRNNWSWRRSFLNTNTSYVTGCIGLMVSCSGYAGAIVSGGYSVMSTGGNYQNTFAQLNRSF